ncbi:MAG: photosystem I reaction center subunit PsaK [Cyanobacteria bacterium P01_G01_bin.38]
MNQLMLLATDIPRTVEWGPQVAIVMILCNIAAIALGKATMRNLAAGPGIPSSPAVPSAQFLGGMGWPALLGTTSLGHILGLGAILGLANLGVL